MQLIDKEQNATFAVFDFREDRLEAFFKLATVFGSGHQRAHIERKDGFIFDALGHVAAHNALRQAFDNRGLTHARLTNEHRIVLGLAGENADHTADLVVATDHRIHFTLTRLLNQIDAVFLERFESRFRVAAADVLAAPHGLQGFEDFRTIQSKPLEELRRVFRTHRAVRAEGAPC